MGYRQFPALQAKQIKVTQLFAIRALLWLSMAPPFPLPHFHNFHRKAIEKQIREMRVGIIRVQK